jgi:thiamine-phosphate diphosphorylase
MLVTARHRLEAVGRRGASWQSLLTEQIEGALAGGVDLVQIREPDLGARVFIHFLHDLFRNVPLSRDQIVINDRVDVAVAAGVRGVHLPERSFDVETARRLLGDREGIVGRSVHSADEAARSPLASYLAAGTVLSSPSKQSDTTLLGWGGFRSVVKAAGRVPVLAIGGMTDRSVAAVVAAGGSGVAAIGWFIPGDNRPLARFVQERAASIVSLFDSSLNLS